MWPGWVALGPGDPFTGDEYVELVNNQRAYSYARNAGISWLQECLDCPEAALVMPGGPDFKSPELDPAPWYDEENPDTWGFYGVVGLEVVGADTSTRQVTITNTLQAGGVAGPPYFGPRTIVFRGLLVAQDECSLMAGLDWLRYTCVSHEDPCHGDALTFFDCCPCVCTDEAAIGPCWVDTYADLRLGPVCARLRPAPPAYWDGTTGSFIGPYTAQPGRLPDTCTFVYHVHGPGSGEGPIASQWEAGANLRSWQIERDGSPGQVRLSTSATGTATSLVQSADDAAPSTSDQYLALSREVVGGQQRIHSWVGGSSDGPWSKMNTSAWATNVEPLDIAATRVMRIGTTMVQGAPGSDTHFQGRIYSVELKTGLDPSGDAITNAIQFPGTANNYLSVPDSAALDVPSDLEVVFRLDFKGDFVMGKWGAAGQRSWQITCTDTPAPGRLTFAYSLDGTASTAPSATVDFDPSADAPGWYKVTRSALTGDISFYSSTSASATEPSAGSWGLVVFQTSTPGPLFNSNAPVTFGGNATTASRGILHRAIVRNIFGSGTRLCAFSNVAGVRLAAPADPVLNMTGDLDIAIHANMGTTDTNQHTFVAKSGGANNRSWEVGYTNSRWNFRFAVAAAPGTIVSVQPNIAQTSATHWLRVTRSATTGAVTMYTAPDQVNEPTSWTPITGTPVTSTTGALVNSTAPVELGGRNSAVADMAHGRLLNAIIHNGIGGPVVFRFDEDDPPHAAVDTFTSQSGHTMTVHRAGTGTCLYGTVLDLTEDLIPDNDVPSFPTATDQVVTVVGTVLVELPAETLWRFDASEHPLGGPFPLGSIDRRGRLWYLPTGALSPPELAVQGDAWWPRTYAELSTGPPADDDDWCAWVRRYYDLTNGPPGWTCCVDECVVPYLRQFYNARITEGPLILSQPAMHSCGALAEIEVTLVAADPRKYAMPSAALRTIVDPGEPLVAVESISAQAADPFAIPGVTVSRLAASRVVEAPAMSTSWVRTTTTSVPPVRGNILRTAVPIITLGAIDGDVGEVRLGLWRGGFRIGGYWLPFVPGGTSITIDGGLRRVIGNNGHERVLSNFARDYDGGRVVWPDLGHGTFEVTVDQEPERAGRLAIEVHAVDVALS